MKQPLAVHVDTHDDDREAMMRLLAQVESGHFEKRPAEHKAATPRNRFDAREAVIDCLNTLARGSWSTVR